MPCLLALIVFSILGIFSASHRSLAKEAFSCVFNRITLRPCNSGFKEKIKGKILSKIINRSEFLAKMVNKHYEILSWIFFVLMVGSTIWVFRGGYNFYVYGSCNGLNDSGFCAFDPKGDNNKVSTLDKPAQCGTTKDSGTKLSKENVDMTLFPSIKTESKDTIFFIGCYGCDYTRKSYPDILKLIDKEKANFVFAHYPAKTNTEFFSNIDYCVYKNYGDKFWDFNKYMLTEDKDYILNPSNWDTIFTKFSFDKNLINKCTNSVETKDMVEKQLKELEKTNLYGTPTIFIKDKAFVGPKPYRVYRSAINKYIFF